MSQIEIALNHTDWESLLGEPSATTNTVFPPAFPFTDNELGFVSPISRSFIRTVQHFITTFEKTIGTCLRSDWAGPRKEFCPHFENKTEFGLRNGAGEVLRQEKVVGEKFCLYGEK